MDDTKIWCRIVKDSEGVQLRSTGVVFVSKEGHLKWLVPFRWISWMFIIFFT